MFWEQDFDLWGSFLIANVMSRKQFERILRSLHFAHNLEEDATTPQISTKKDKLHKIRTLCDMMRERFKKSYHPSRQLSVDEAIVKFRGRVGFKTYNPAKPVKYGYKVWILCDSDGYLYDLDI